MILLERDLGVLHDGMLEGRRTFGNMIKYMLMGTSSNFGNMFSMAGASLFLPFLPMLPDADPAEQLPLRPLRGRRSRPTRRRRATCAARSAGTWRFIRRFMLVIGPVSSLFDFLTFCVLLACSARGRGAVPDRLVRRVAGDPGAGDLRHPHARQPAAQPARAVPLAVTSCWWCSPGCVLPFTPLGARWASCRRRRSFRGACRWWPPTSRPSSW